MLLQELFVELVVVLGLLEGPPLLVSLLRRRQSIIKNW
jgi:hypothetical protein